eukprot:SAG31_NODE_29349_length_396_cov_1.363636_1_plen_47_part_10
MNFLIACRAASTTRACYGQHGERETGVGAGMPLAQPMGWRPLDARPP